MNHSTTSNGLTLLASVIITPRSPSLNIWAYSQTTIANNHDLSSVSHLAMMSRPPYNIFLGTYPPTQPQPIGPPANIVARAQQILHGGATAARPPANVVAHAERMVAEEARRRREVAS